MNSNVFSIFSAMEKVCPSVARRLQVSWQLNLRDYIDQIWAAPPSCQSEISVNARRAFYSAFRQFPASQNIDYVKAIAEFDAAPILQTGPHCQLFVNEIDFNALLFSWMGSKLYQLNYAFILNSATRTLQWSKGCGPAWLNLQNDNINLFGMSPKKMSRLSVCAPSISMTYQKSTFDHQLLKALPEERDGLIKLFSVIDSAPYPDVISAFTLPNLALIKNCDQKSEVQPVILNDHFTAYVVAEHLKDSEGIISNLLFSSNKREQLNGLIEELKKTPQHIFLTQGTQFFWGMRDNKIRPLMIIDDFLIEVTAGKDNMIKIPFTPEDLCSALYNGQLIPNIFLSFLVLSLMPQIRVLGGTRQIAYFPLIKNLFCELLDKNNSVEAELFEELQSNSLNVWGTNFIRHTFTPLQWLGQLPAGKELACLTDFYLNQSIAEITQQLMVFKDHQKWKHLI